MQDSRDEDRSATIFGLAVTSAIVAFAIIVATIIGCASRPKPSGPDATPHIGHAQDAVADIAPRTVSIDKHTVDIEKKLPAKAVVTVAPHTSGIRAESAVIRRDAEVATTGLTQAQGETDALKKDKTTLLAANAKLTAENKSSLRKAVGGAVGIGIIGMALSAAVFFGGYTKWAKMGAAFSLTLTLAGMIVGWYSLWLTLAIIVPFAIGLSIWIIYRIRNESWSTYRSVGVIDALKQELNEVAPEKRAEFFGVGALPGTIDNIDAKLGIPQGAKDLTDVARDTLPAKATPLAVATPIVMAQAESPAAPADTTTTTTTRTATAGRRATARRK